MSRTPLYNLLASYILKHSGIVYDEKNFFQLDSRIDLLKKNLKLASDFELQKIIQAVPLRPEVHTMIIDTATNNETFFYRDSKVFTALEKNIFSKFESPATKLRIWSLACSSGQEACSIIMSHDKYSKGKKFDIEILASDLSTKILDKAISGVYSQMEVQRGLPIADLVKYFEPEGEHIWKMKREFHSKVNFSQFNMLKDPFPLAKFHIVFCRNVLIYQEIPQRKEVIKSILGSLLPGGYLVLGNSENLLNLSSDYEMETFEGCSFYKKPAAAKPMAA